MPSNTTLTYLALGMTPLYLKSNLDFIYNPIDQRKKLMETLRATPTLPDEIIADILSRLPVKSLLRFKCVSKPWRNLISNPSFAKLHLKRTSEHNTNIDHNTILISSSLQFMSMNFNSSESYQYNELELECPLTGPKDYMKILGSCNGLIYLRVGSYDMVIWNPSTREYKVYLKPGFLPHQFAFGGFGFDASIDDYKVVVCSYNLASVRGPIEVEVLTLKTNTWRKVQDIEYQYISYEAGALANGALHWLQKDGAIMSFDLAQEHTGELVSLPDSAKKCSNVEDIELGILHGCLCVYIPEVEKNDEVWVLQEYNVQSSWSKMFIVSSATRFCSIDYNYIIPVCLLKNGEVLINVDGHQLVRFNPKDHTFKHVRDGHERFSLYDGSFEVIVFEESLVSLN